MSNGNISVQVLFEDNHLLVINKPAGMATMGALPDVPSATKWAADYLKQKYDKPGNVFVGVVSRLDSLVTGVLVLARTSKAASRLTEQFREQKTQKLYWACVEGQLELTQWQEFEIYVRKNDALHRMVAAKKDAKGSQLATLRLKTMVSLSSKSLVEVQLGTGRKHQIRLQLSELGHPVLGDKKYGANLSWSEGIALHCYQLTIEHPTRKEPLTFCAPAPQSWHVAPPAFRELLNPDKAGF